MVSAGNQQQPLRTCERGVDALRVRGPGLAIVGAVNEQDRRANVCGCRDWAHVVGAEGGLRFRELERPGNVAAARDKRRSLGAHGA